MQTCKYHSNNQDGINPGGQNEKDLSWKQRQGEHVHISDNNAAASSSYAAFLHNNLSCNNTKEHRARMQEASMSIYQSHPVGALQNEHCCILTPPLIQKPLPSAPHRLRIRRQSMRQETVDLLAVLDDLIRRPGLYSRKARDGQSISSIAEFILENKDDAIPSSDQTGRAALSIGFKTPRTRARNEILDEVVGMIWKLVSDDEVCPPPNKKTMSVIDCAIRSSPTFSNLTPHTHNTQHWNPPPEEL
jgi:hypothetical protein